MAGEPHDVVKLLLARMESHPEEFRLKDPSYHDRWYNHMSAINTYGNETDKAALAGKIRDIRLAEIHEEVMDELCNGEERRRKEAEENEYERHLAQSLKHMKQQQARQHLTAQQMAQQAQQGLQNAFANAYDVDLDMYRNTATTHIAGQGPISIANGGTGTTGTITAAKSEPTLSSSTINQIKKALGLKSERGE